MQSCLTNETEFESNNNIVLLLRPLGNKTCPVLRQFLYQTGGVNVFRFCNKDTLAVKATVSLTSGT